MRYVIALGGNALLQRDEAADAAVQRHHVQVAAAALAPVVAEHEVIICHGNGPQIGLLALESGSDPSLHQPYPLDVLGAQTQGMIGYWFAQELANAGVRRPIAVVVTQTEVDGNDPAFTYPTKFIGATYTHREAVNHTRQYGWSVAVDGSGWRRVVPSPEPLRIVELPIIQRLVASGAVVVCAGGGGAPVVADNHGRHGVEAVVDKDLTSALLAEAVGADRLVILTDVAGVMSHFGTPAAQLIARLDVAEVDASTFPAGSMGPKIRAGARFAARTGHPTVIGALADAADVIDGRAGTTIVPSAAPTSAS